MKRKAVALGACVVVGGSTLMPLKLNAVEPKAPTSISAEQTRDAQQGDPLDIKVTLKAKGTEDLIKGLEVTMDCEGKESVKVTSDDNGVLNLNLPGYGVYKLTSDTPEGFATGVGTTITYSADNKPEANLVLELAKEESENKQEVRGVEIKHIDEYTEKLVKGGKGQILDQETKEVVVKDIDLAEGTALAGELKVGKAYTFEWLEEAEGYEGNKETLNFTVVEGEGIQTVVIKSYMPGGEETVAVDMKFQLQDYETKEELKQGKAVFTQKGGDKTFEIDFAKPETLTQKLNSGEEYDFKVTGLPEGYELYADQFMYFKVDGKEASSTMTIYAVKGDGAGQLGSTGAGGSTDTSRLPQTGAVAAGGGVAGLSAIGAFLLKKFRR